MRAIGGEPVGLLDDLVALRCAFALAAALSVTFCHRLHDVVGDSFGGVGLVAFLNPVDLQMCATDQSWASERNDYRLRLSKCSVRQWCDSWELDARPLQPLAARIADIFSRAAARSVHIRSMTMSQLRP